MENSIFTSNNNIADLSIDHTNLLGIPYLEDKLKKEKEKLYTVHKAINNNQAQRFGKWKTNEEFFQRKTTQVSDCIKNSLEEPITIVYLKNIYTTSLSL